MRVALDRDVVKLALHSHDSDPASADVAELVRRAATICVLPSVVEELTSELDDSRRRWRDAGFEEVRADEFFKGCAAGIARRYLDYHPDPRHCRLVAEAECAKADLLVTLNADLINGLARRAEKVRISTPSNALRRTTSYD